MRDMKRGYVLQDRPPHYTTERLRLMEEVCSAAIDVFVSGVPARLATSVNRLADYDKHHR